MSLKKDKAFKDIFNDFEVFANLVLTQMDLLDEIITIGKTKVDDDSFKKIAENEKKIDNFEVSITEKIADTIVLYSPMASDLRKILACYRVILNLERIGDLVVGISKFYTKIEGEEIINQSQNSVIQMYEQSYKMVQKSIMSFFNADKSYAIWTIKNDEVVNESNRKILKKVIKKNHPEEKEQRMIFSFINAKSIISDIERIADQAKNIAEASIYSMEGTDLRHKNIDEVG